MNGLAEGLGRNPCLPATHSPALLENLLIPARFFFVTHRARPGLERANLTNQAKLLSDGLEICFDQFAAGPACMAVNHSAIVLKETLVEAFALPGAMNASASKPRRLNSILRGTDREYPSRWHSFAVPPLQLAAEPSRFHGRHREPKPQAPVGAHVGIRMTTEMPLEVAARTYSFAAAGPDVTSISASRGSQKVSS